MLLIRTHIIQLLIVRSFNPIILINISLVDSIFNFLHRSVAIQDEVCPSLLLLVVQRFSVGINESPILLRHIVMISLITALAFDWLRCGVKHLHGAEQSTTRFSLLAQSILID